MASKHLSVEDAFEMIVNADDCEDDTGLTDEEEDVEDQEQLPMTESVLKAMADASQATRSLAGARVKEVDCFSKAFLLRSSIMEHEKDTYNGSPREVWAHKIEFTLVCIGAAVGLGNIWRFPYLCYRSGGGAFLIPYLLMLVICGIPLFYMEVIMGQYRRRGMAQAFAMICPLFKGVGVSSVAMCFMLSVSYNMIMVWALFYFIHSFCNPLPWHSEPNSSTVSNFSSGQHYFNQVVLRRSPGISQPMGICWDLFGLLVFTWLLVYICLFRGIQFTGKVVYFTVMFPYFILLALLINNCFLTGAWEGVRYFIVPDWRRLADVQVWVNAAAQIFNSLGISFGTVVIFSSYNKFDNNPLRDVLIVSFANSATSIFSGFVIFSGMGYMAVLQGKAVEEIATEGPGLVFEVYPEIITTMPLAPFWSVAFFFMLIFLGLDSQFAMVEVAVMFVMDSNASSMCPVLRRKAIVVLMICFGGFLLGLPMVTQAGIYFFQLVDHHSSVVTLVFIAFFEVTAVCWLYGVPLLSRNVEEMTGKRPALFFRVCWYFLSPCLVTIMLIFSLVRYEPVHYGDYTYPSWAVVLGWLITIFCIIWIPLGIIHTLATSPGTPWQRMRVSIVPCKPQHHEIQSQLHVKESLPDVSNNCEHNLNSNGLSTAL
uniref:sodium- and chloride-dependent GABA transporter ine-like isoform X2 n=1 Tax=Myxine glutinosa TaxID=7769 RepID=UPI00358FA78A